MFIAKISINAAVPKLVITQQSGNNFKLTWPGSSPVFSLESTTNLLATGSWTAVPQPPVFSNGTYNVTLPATNNQQFFRLRKS
jgi:hypothetical protein